jgi:hypothetical protein
MVMIPGIIIALVTFPGVILHEWSHKFFCDRAGIPVFEVKYFRLGNPAGYVRHGELTRYRDAFLITIAPFIVNSLAAMAMFALYVFNIDSILNLLLLWLGVSFGAHAFPSGGDAKSLFEHSRHMWRNNPLALLGFPLVGIIALANLLRVLWFDFIYAVALFLVTLILVNAVLLAGSPIVPGLAAFVISPTPHPAPTFHYGSATPNPTTAKPAPVQTTPGLEAPAKDWLPVAQEAMESRNSNAILINVEGRSNDHGINLPINGKCHWWRYIYASQAEGLVYDVIVHDGTLESVKTRDLVEKSVEGIEFSYGDPTIRSWNVDSVEAATTSNAKLKELTGLDAPVSAAYSLELSCWDRLTWTVYNYDTRTSVIADISIDQETGEISNAWVNPNK